MKPKDATSWALKLVNDLPTEYKVAAFQEFLRFQLSNASEESIPVTKQKEVKAETLTRELSQQPLAWVASVIDAFPKADVIRKDGSEDQKVAWAVACLARDGQMAINKSIGDYIRMNLGISPPNRQNINRALRKLLPKYLSREKYAGGKGLSYLPRPGIAELFEDLKNDAV